MARLSCSILSGDEGFKAQLATVLRGSSLSIVSGERGAPGASSDVIVVDGRDDPDAAVAAVEHLRSADPTAGISSARRRPADRFASARGSNSSSLPPTPEALDEPCSACIPPSSSPPQGRRFFGVRRRRTTTWRNCGRGRTPQRDPRLVDLSIAG